MGDQDQRMQIRVKSGLSKSRPSQMNGPRYLDQIVRRSTLFDSVFTFPHLETSDSISTSILGYLSMISDLSFGKCLLLSLLPTLWRIDGPRAAHVHRAKTGFESDRGCLRVRRLWSHIQYKNVYRNAIQTTKRDACRVR